MLNFTLIATIAICVALATVAQGETRGAFYGGAGLNNDSAQLQLDETPFVLGVLFYPTGHSFVLGFDIAGEGEMFDSTFGANDLRQAYSFNAVIGANLYRSEQARTDISAVIGFREAFADCPDSFIGFQCYADQPPETDYTMNYGALLSFNYNNGVIGLRVTDQSAQAILGLNF